MPPGALDLRALEDELDPGPVEVQVSDQQLAMGRYRQFGVSVNAGRLQLDTTKETEPETLRAAAAWVLSQVAPFKPTALGFNVVVAIAAEEGEDPVSALLDLGKAGERLGAEDGRGGIEVVFRRDGARWTIAVSPDAEDESFWTATQNRHHDTFPDELGDLLDWFVGLDRTYPAEIEKLLKAE